MTARAYRRYLLAVLSLILAFNYVDRMALGLALQNIKLDLHLSDTELGLLTGIAFAFFFAVMGIPIGSWADRGNRVRILWLTRLVWGAMVSLTGLATSFVQLLLIRSGAAVGEAGCVPPANSLIPDYYGRAERARAMAIFLMGSSLSLVVGYLGAGWLNQLFGWRVMFEILGVPGLALAALTAFTLKEPRLKRRTQRSAENPRTLAVHSGCGTPSSSSALPSLWEVLKTLWGITSFRYLLMVFSVGSFFGAGAGDWLPTFFLRSYGFKTGELGIFFTLVYGLPSLLGLYLGGEWASRWAANNERLQLQTIAAVQVGFSIIWALVYLTHSILLAFALIVIATLGANTTTAPMQGMILTLVPPRMRAMSMSIIFLFTNLIGLGLGPLATGALSDALRAHFGQESLRYALLILDPGFVWVGWYVWRASQNITRDLEGARAQGNETTSG